MDTLAARQPWRDLGILLEEQIEALGSPPQPYSGTAPPH
jgi:hypothetical protein